MSELAKALVAFQAKCPNIPHNTIGQLGHRQYGYTNLAGILEVGDGHLTTRLMCASGEQIETSMPLPLAGKMMQGIGSCLTYCRRYQLGALLNLATESDDDGELANGRASKLASTFSMAPPPPMGLKQQLIASLAEKGKKPAVVRGNGITALRARMHELNAALREATDLDMLAGTLRGFDDDLIECAEKLPDWYFGAERAISERRKALSMPA